ncbi:HtrA family serine protease [Minicystis rosea]|nr:HtrA family serine protease [Minicystis rosea]
MDVFRFLAAPTSPLRPSIDSPIVKRASRSLLPAFLAVAAIVAPGDARADDPPGAVELAGPPAQLPPRKGSPPPAAPPKAEKGDKADAAKKEMSPEERALRGVVILERAGQPLGLGAVLMGDGRILTALSPLGPGNDLDARFADGSTARVKLGHHDRAWDLALLVPQTGRWAEGVAASTKEPVRPDATIRSFTVSRSKISATNIILRSHRPLLGGDDKPINDAIEIGSRISPLDLGAPIIDEDGRVVAVLGRGCAPNDNRPCTPVAFGAPIAAVKTFLRGVPASAVPPAPFLGIQGVAETAGVARGVRVVSVAPHSPAEEAKLKGGDRAESDVILAVDGAPVTSPEALSDAIRSHGVGEKVTLMLFTQGKYREVSCVLRAAPEKASAPPPPANPAELPPANDGPPPAAPPPPARKPAPPPTHR